MGQQSSKRGRQFAAMGWVQIQELRQKVLRRIGQNLGNSKETVSLSIWDALIFDPYPTTLPSERAWQEKEKMDANDIIRRSWELTGDYMRLAMLDYEAGLRKNAPDSSRRKF